MHQILRRSAVFAALVTLSGCGSDGLQTLGESRSGLVWTSQATLLPSDGGGNGAFLALGGDVALLGVPTHYHTAKTGAVYVFRRSSAGAWQEEQELIPIGAASNDEVGTGVAVDGDRIAIGARSDDAAGTDAGSVFVFERINASWQEVATVLPPDPNYMAWFGNSVALDGDLMAVGAPFYVENNTHRGAVYVFARNGTSWLLEQRLVPPADKPMGGFGADVDLENGTLIVGAPTMSSIGQASGTGRAYAYVRDAATNTWSLQGTLNAGAGIPYGNVVELSGDRALVSLRSGLVPQGVAHVYERTGTTWSAGTQLNAEGLTGNDAFGYAIGFAGGDAFASAPAGDDLGDKSGRVHVFSSSSGWAQSATFHSPAPSPGAGFGGGMVGDGLRLLVGDTFVPRAYIFELTAGSGGSAGSAGNGGASGSSGSAGTSSAGGSAGSTSSGGSGGIGTGGSGATATGGSGGVGAGASSGSGASGGSVSAGGSGAAAAAPGSSGGGCGCRTAPRGSNAELGLLALLALTGFARVVRRRSR